MKHFRFLNMLVAIWLALALIGFPSSHASAGGALVVTMVNDGSDANPGDGFCAISGGSCTLRAAIEEANAHAGADNIIFSLPGAGIHVMSITSGPLPTITDTLNLDGTSQPNCTVPCIVLSGASLPAGAKHGLRVASNNSIIKGFIITSWNTSSGPGNSYGIFITGNNNIIQANDIGFWPGNPTPLGNGSGISLFGTGNLIGGTTPNERNVISGNGYGIVVANAVDGNTPTSGNKIQGNYIGANAAGNAALGNQLTGVVVFMGGSNTLIGGPTSGARNVISGNRAGIYYTGSTTTIQNNFIGTNAAGNAGLGNTQDGIYSDAGSGVITGNRIAFNAGKGINIYGSAVRATVRRNSIFSNTSLGIDLGSNGVTLNDTGDVDAGPNRLQNFPSIISATSSTRVVTGRLSSRANTKYTVEIYSSPTCDSSHYGEGKVYLGAVSVTTNGSGVGSFSVAVLGNFAVGSKITATAIDPAGNTSEFSACRAAN
ncbi:MAG: CSLREA domain-containing protein [Chloroflexi bacterium]|nr:CSLREA domain-containing protein [Chloroflexota bacterium]